MVVSASRSAGPPLPPAVVSTLTSATELTLEWEQPFTWPDHNVSHYEITEQVDSGAPSRFDTTGLSHSYSSSDGEIMKECQNVTFVVTAVSDLGPSDPSVLTTGLPIRKRTLMNYSQLAIAVCLLLQLWECLGRLILSSASQKVVTLKLLLLWR